jgi:hypothetical protein
MKNLAPEFSFDGRFRKNAPSPPNKLDEAEQAVGCIFPDSYRQFLLSANGGVGCIGTDGYIDLWPVERVVGAFHDYQFDVYAPSFVPIGSNGGNEAFVIKHSGSYSSFGYLPFDSMEDGDFVEISQDFWTSLSDIGKGRVFK